jgi:hypothetical protein
MRPVIERLFPFLRSRRAHVTCYLRENGPLAYELELFGAASPRERAGLLLDSGLAWAWKGGPREWTELTRISLPAFLGDLTLGALLVGVDGELPTHVTDETVKGWLRCFCRVDPAPLAAAASVSPDRQLIFVQQHASPAVSALLDAFDLDRRSAVRTAYARLGAAGLERIADSL